MGCYMYRVTAKVVKLPDGRTAHVAKYAYKPYRSWNGEKENARMHFQSGCYSSERMTLQTDLITTMETNDETGRLYHNVRGLKTFLDDEVLGTDNMPCIGTLRRDGKRIAIDPK